MVSTQQTLRVTGLPSKTQQSDVIQFFAERIKRKHGRQIVEFVGTICGHASRSTKRTTVSFSSYKTAQKALNLGETSRWFIAKNGGAETITLDASFLDLTTLHSSNNPATGKPDVDIVALHGLTGHGWNSFATSSSVDENAGRTKETNWLRDILPRLLEQNQQQHIHPRVMTYGYDADVWMTRNVADIDVPVHNLLTYLDTERREDPERPLYFIGHSLGGIVIKQAIVELADQAMLKSLQEPQGSTKQYNFPVKGCMFFGVPNRGADIAGTASSILKLLSSVFNVNKNVVRDLESKSQQLANFASQFRQVREGRNIPVISFFETEIYSSVLGLIVDKDSAVIEYPGSPRPFGINRNHKEMARFSSEETHALEPAIDFLAQFARTAVNARQHSHLPVPRPAPYVTNRSNLEDKYSTLESYDTVFLVDDSPSMAGERWDLVKKILDYSTAVATAYDPDGIDVHFLNNKTANRNNIKDPAIAVEVHQNIVLRGSTPILDQLSRHLNSYVQMFKNRRAEEINFKGYNFIVLTDGEPNPEYEDADEISDVEDARKYSAAYRRIRKTIVGVARALDKAGAERTQVGIQFCQIGNDDGAHKFFRFLDNQLKGTYKLGRDMVDTVHCSSEADLTQTFFYKLLLGAIDKVADHEEISKDSSQREGTGWSPEERPNVNVKSKNGETPLLPATIGAFDKEGESELSQAAYNGNKALAELLIEKGADVGRSNELGMTALLWSAACGHMDVLQLLIGKGADIGASEKGGWTALHLSAYNGHTDVVELLLKANTNGGGRGEQPVLGSVVGANNAKKRPMSISGNLDVNSKEKHIGQTSLHLASRYGHTAVIAVLLKYHANTSALDSDEWTALHFAAYNRNTETVKLLTSQMRALSIRAKNRNGDTALTIAADERYTSIVQHLINCQVDLTPHDGASSDGVKWDTMERTDPKQVDAIGALLESEELSEDSPDIQQKDTQRMTLYWAARNGYKSLVDKLLPSIEEGESLGQVLYWAAVGGQEAVVKSILETRKQSDLNAILSKDNAKTVQAAAQNGHERVVEILLQKLMKVDENEALTRKWTPLHWAVRYDAEEAVDVVRYMLTNGANPEATNPEGIISAVDMARDLKAEHQNDSKIAKIVDLLETPLRHPRKPLQLVEPNNDAEGLEDVCKQFHSNIIDFYPFGGRFYTVERKSVVYDIIYQSGPDKIMSQARDIWEIDLEHHFRWIHLPANNWIWAEDLMKRISYESKKSAIEYTRLENFVEQNRREHLGKTHCRFMYPTLSFESKDFYSGEGANITKLRSKQKKGERDKTNKQKSAHSVQEAPAATDNVVDRIVSEVGTAKGLATDSIDSTGDFKHEINNVQVLTNEETKTHETKPEEIKAGDTKTEDTRAKRARPEESKDSGLKISKQQPEAHIENEKQKKNEKEKSREEGGIAHLEGSKIAICIPFLTFQTVASQRKLRQATKLAEEIRCPSEENQYIESATSLDKVGLARMVILRGEIDKGIALLKKTIRKQNLASKGMRKKLQTLLERIETVKRNGNSESKENLDSLSKFLEHFKSEDVPSEILEWQERLQDGIEMVGQNEKTTENNNVKSAALKHEALLQHYLRLNEEWKGLHVSRTLDQYYYSALSDTSRRDIDQVVRRYQARKYMVKAQEKMSKTNENARDPDFQIGMVDQLWLWIIDDKTIITCFPQRWTQDTESSQRSELLDKIRSHIHEDMRPQISSVYHLATIITSMCVGFVEDCHARLPDGPESLLHMFASSIGIVADEEVKCFDAFKRELASRDSRDGKGSSISSSSQELDLHKEIQLLEEVKDIRDELNILNSICQEQKDLLQRLFGLIARPRPAAEQIEIAKDPVLNYYQERSDIHLRIERIRKMQMDATTTYDALNHLLDLKQKHANISEAIQARKQAEQATKQGRTILVFTIVTVIFLPMSFLTSLFALNVESFPRSAGSLSYPPKWIFPRIFGTSAALAFPLIFMAIYINNFLKESPHQDGQNGDFDDDMQESKVLSWTSQVSEDVSPASKQNYWRSFTKKAFGRETSSLKVESQLERGEKIVDKGASG